MLVLFIIWILGWSSGFRNLASPSNPSEWTWLDPMVGIPFCPKRNTQLVHASDSQISVMMQNLYNCQINRMEVLEARIKSMQGVYNSDKNKFKRYRIFSSNKSN